ncbi:UNVERIFIED_CONTAM: hypothetical protein Sindi_2259900 [Sesamum indicum]
MTNDIQKQYNRYDDVQSIMLRMSQVYAIADRHIRYAVTKAFFGAKMIEGYFVQEHGVKILSLVEKLKDLKANVEKKTYIDVILQSLPPSCDPFIGSLQPQKRKAKGRTLDEDEELLQALRALLLPSWAWANGSGRRHRSHGFQKGLKAIFVP